MAGRRARPGPYRGPGQAVHGAGAVLRAQRAGDRALIVVRLDGRADRCRDRHRGRDGGGRPEAARGDLRRPGHPAPRRRRPRRSAATGGVADGDRTGPVHRPPRRSRDRFEDRSVDSRSTRLGRPGPGTGGGRSSSAGRHAPGSPNGWTRWPPLSRRCGPAAAGTARRRSRRRRRGRPAPSSLGRAHCRRPSRRHRRQQVHRLHAVAGIELARWVCAVPRAAEPLACVWGTRGHAAAGVAGDPVAAPGAEGGCPRLRCRRALDGLVLLRPARPRLDRAVSPGTGRSPGRDGSTCSCGCSTPEVCRRQLCTSATCARWPAMPPSP